MPSPGPTAYEFRDLARNKARACTRALSRALGHIESVLLTDRPLRHPPTFVLGPPRSGSTLLGQLLTYALDVAYLPSLPGWMPCEGRPPAVWLTRAARALSLTEPRAEFASHYGAAGVGDAADSERLVWHYVLPEGHLEPNDLSDAARRASRAIVSGIERVFCRPFVDKSVAHAIRIPALLDLFPDALFVRIRRNPLAVAQSVYLGRSRSDAMARAWPTPKARGYETLRDKTLLEQACGQMALFEAEIDEAWPLIPASRRTELSYEDVCDDPQRAVTAVAELLCKSGAPTTQVEALPPRLRRSEKRRVDRDTYDRIAELVSRTYAEGFTALAEPEDDPPSAEPT